MSATSPSNSLRLASRIFRNFSRSRFPNGDFFAPPAPPPAPAPAPAAPAEGPEGINGLSNTDARLGTPAEGINNVGAWAARPRPPPFFETIVIPLRAGFFWESDAFASAAFGVAGLEARGFVAAFEPFGVPFGLDATFFGVLAAEREVALDAGFLVVLAATFFFDAEPALLFFVGDPFAPDDFFANARGFATDFEAFFDVRFLVANRVPIEGWKTPINARTFPCFPPNQRRAYSHGVCLSKQGPTPLRRSKAHG
ncbi:MAG: hypothetical protein H6811_00665 [Phycisphaeraceae bacterium]|nr:hypothetical protein [Phycisphaeraceae bacterium]